MKEACNYQPKKAQKSDTASQDQGQKKTILQAKQETEEPEKSEKSKKARNKKKNNWREN